MSTIADVQTVNVTEKGYRVYHIPNVDHPIVARKGGPTAEDVKDKESYQELRNNQREFGLASMLAKTLRDAIPSSVSRISEKYSSGKLTAQFRNLAQLEEGVTGQRPLSLSKNGGKIAGFEFNAEKPFTSNFKVKHFSKQGSHRGHLILHFPAFIPVNELNVPEEATNFKINAQLTVISDYYYDDELEGYVGHNKDYNGLSGYYETPMLPVLKIPTQSITTQLSVNNGRPVPERTGLLLILSLRFFKYQEFQFHQLDQDSSMQIVQVF